MAREPASQNRGAARGRCPKRTSNPPAARGARWGGSTPSPFRTESERPAISPLTLGIAGHVDHGKTTLVEALTGVNTDRLPEEQERGMSISLGFAPLDLPSGRRISIVDVPGHERFVRTMVAGSTGIDFYLLVVAADDGVMPQTVEHLDVLDALGIEIGMVAVSKSDLADPSPAVAAIRELLPGAPIVVCSGATKGGIDEVIERIDMVARSICSSSGTSDPPLMHIDRVFSVDGAGTVVTGTLQSGEITVGDRLEVTPAGMSVRIRGLEVHNESRVTVRSGERVAVNLAGIKRSEVQPGSALTVEGVLHETSIVDCELNIANPESGVGIHVHHGTRCVSGRLIELARDMYQLRLDAPIAARNGDRVVIRQLNPAVTIGGGRILDSKAKRHGSASRFISRLEAIRDGHNVVSPVDGEAKGSASTEATSQKVVEVDHALELRLRESGFEPIYAEPGSELARALGAMVPVGVATRVAAGHFLHFDVVTELKERVRRVVELEGGLTLGRLRDELGVSRRKAVILINYLDAARVTVRGPNDIRTILPRSSTP